VIYNFEDLKNSSSNNNFEDFYNGDSDHELYKKYHGRNVIWYGTEGNNLKINAKYVSSREDNIFDTDKLISVKNYILRSEEPVEFEICVADVRKIDFDYIEETQMAYASDRLDMEYSLSRPFTTGDEECDLFIRDFLSWSQQHLMYFDEDYIDVDERTIDMARLKKELEDGDIESDTYEEYADMHEEYKNVMDYLKEAEEKSYGDYGQLWAVMRDGNHRVMGAIMANEPYIYVTPYDLKYANKFNANTYSGILV